MRIHQLELQALGPFAGREVIDFDALGSGILLVNGPTGSGKSSLLDAIAYALFGDVPGARKSLRSSLRSHHAPADRESSVELTFSVGPQRWKISRSPEWDAPKKRAREGTSTTTKRQASVVLSRWRDDAWHAEATRLDEAGQVINDILGMGLAQFAQVIVLPQGEFAAFLRAKPEDRRILLERLFDVERFDRIETWFQERKGASVKARSESLTTLQNYVALITESVASLDATSAGTSPSEEAHFAVESSLDVSTLSTAMDTFDPSALEDEIARVVTDLATTGETHRAHSQAADRAVGRARQASTSSSQVIRARAKWKKAQADAEEWTQERVTRLNTQVEQAQAARVVCEAFARQANAAHAWQQASESTTTALNELDAALATSVLGAEQLLASPDVDVTTERALFEQAQHDKRQLDAAEHAKWAAEKSSVSSTAELVTARSVFEEAQHAVTTATETGSAAQRRLEEAPDSSATVRQLKKILADLTKRAPLLHQEVEASQTAFQQTTQNFSEAEAHTLHLRGLRLEGIAGELAQDLAPGKPCLVCGSCDHPAPAPLSPNTPSDDDIDTAEQSAAQQNDIRLAAATRHASSTQALASFTEDIEHQLALVEDDSLTLDAQTLVSEAADENDSERVALRVLSAALERHQSHVEKRIALEAAHRAASETHQAAELRLQRAEVALARAATQQENTVSALHQAEEAYTSAHKLWQEMRGKLSSTRVLPWTDDEPLVDVVARYAQIESARSRALRAHEIAELRHESLKDAERDFVAALNESPFTSMDVVRAAYLDAAATSELQAEWRTGVEIRAQLEQILSDLENQVAALTPEPNMDVMANAVDQAEEEARVAKEIEAQWASAHASVRRTQARIREEIVAFSKLDTEAATMAALADAFTGSGDNERRMRLTSYVLAAHLEMVTTFANHRLTRMSGGRYQLQHTDELAARGRKSGLGLQVVDAWTGRARDTATLSGGEAFMASLALALGLGDAVLADSGGMKLDTLFVDEGFGSLDQDTLEEVMAVLDELREGGRLVGIISHVSELRARIPTRIDVVKGPEGSHTRIPTSAHVEV